MLLPVINNDEAEFKFLPSFLHFNALDRIDIYYDYPFGLRASENIVTNYPCHIQLFSR